MEHRIHFPEQPLANFGRKKNKKQPSKNTMAMENDPGNVQK